MQDEIADMPTQAEAAAMFNDKLAMLLKGRRATLLAWKLQHKDDGIPSVLAAFAAAVDVINKHLPQG